MELLTYSTAPSTPLNKARLQLWCAKEVLAEANRTKDNEMKGRAMSYINKDRIELRELCHKLRAKLPAKKLYRIAMAGEGSQFGFWERAHSRQQAMEAATERHLGFSIVQCEGVE